MYGVQTEVGMVSSLESHIYFRNQKMNRNTERQRIIEAARINASMKVAAHVDRVKRDYINAEKEPENPEALSWDALDYYRRTVR